MKPTRICTFTECDRKVLARKLCQTHYRQQRAGKELEQIGGPATALVCSIPGCGRGGKVARGWCIAHYTRWRRHGNPLLGGIVRPKGGISDRFWARVSKTPTCWNWTGVPSDTGYGHIVFEGLDQGAHRVSWEIHNGPIPESMYIDHRCHNKVCVNPGHLRLVTNKQNGENHQGPTAASSTGARGVYLDRRSGRYATQVTHNGERYSAGGFATIEEAGAAVTALRLKLFTHNDRDKVAA